MILLTNEEIDIVEHDFLRDCSSADMVALGRGHWKVILTVMLEAQLKKVVERIKDKSWLSFNYHHDRVRVMWDEDWQALLKECER